MTVRMRVISNNFYVVSIGMVDFYFSYETVVAVRHPETGLVVSENIWSRTTGKHLNMIDPDKDRRVPHAEFGAIVDVVERKISTM